MDEKKLIISPTVFTRDGSLPDPVQEILRADPKSNLGKAIREIRHHLMGFDGARDAFADLVDRLCSAVVLESKIYCKVIRADGSIEDYGLQPCHRVVTTAGVNALVQAILNAFTLPNFKFHANGTSNTAPAIGDTALTTEITTQYNPINVRATGSQTTGSSNNIYHTSGTNLIQAGPVTIQEWGLLSQAAVGGGTLWDHKLVGPFTLNTGDSLNTVYDCQFNAGG